MKRNIPDCVESDIDTFQEHPEVLQIVKESFQLLFVLKCF